MNSVSQDPLCVRRHTGAVVSRHLAAGSQDTVLVPFHHRVWVSVMQQACTEGHTARRSSVLCRNPECTSVKPGICKPTYIV